MYLLCLTAGGGVPLFCRTTGALKQLPFPVIGSLNGVHIFCNSHDVELKSTTTEDSKIVWKLYHSSIALIIVTEDDNASDNHLERLLDLVFQSMVLVYGQDELINIKNVERFKREIKVSHKVIDAILEQAGSGSGFSDVTNCVDVIAGTENAVLQNYIDAFAEAATSPYGCLMVAGKVAIATSQWWNLSSTELVLLPVLVNSLPKCSSRDIAVFLPESSPTVPHRLLTFQLIAGVDVCVICGPKPSLSELEREVERFWRTALESLKSLLRIHPRNFPTSTDVDPNILGLLVLDTDRRRCLSSVHLGLELATKRPGKTLNFRERREALRSFFRTTTGGLWKPDPCLSAPKEGVVDMCDSLQHKVLDTYMCWKTHKCYASQVDRFHVFILYSPLIPTYAMRSVTRKTLNVLIKDKVISPS